MEEEVLMRKEVPAEEDVPLEDKVHMNVCKLSIIFVPINFSYLIQFNLRLQKQKLKVMIKLKFIVWYASLDNPCS